MKAPWHKETSKNVSSPILIETLPAIIIAGLVYSVVQSLATSMRGVDTSGLAELLKDENNLGISTALINTGLPLPLIKLDDGEILAFREWGIDWDSGELTSTNFSQLHWREVEFADKLPTEDNTSGLYAVKLDGVGFCGGKIRARIPSSPSDAVNCCGLVGLKGTVVEHDDGVLRAEYARMLCIWTTTNHSVLYKFLPKLYQNYPKVPIFVCTQKQVMEALFNVALWTRARQMGVA